MRPVVLLLALGCADEPKTDPPTPTSTPVEPADTVVVDSDLPEVPRPDASTTGMSRLVTDELVTATQDLLGLDLDDLVAFPEETLELGFDHLDGSSAVSADLIDALNRFTTGAADRWHAHIRGEPVWTSEVYTWGEQTGCAMEDSWGGGGYWWLLFSQHPVETTLFAPQDGDWVVSIEHFHRIALDGDDGLDLSLSVDGTEVWQGRLLGPQSPAPLEIPVTLTQGNHALALRVTDGLPDDQLGPNGSPRCVTAEAVGLGSVSLVGPRQRSPIGPDCHGSERGCVREWLQPLLTRAWRRPPTPEELDALQGVVEHNLEAGDSPDLAMAVALRAALMSPHFLFLPEDEGALPPWQLAARLARTLWASVPDETLLACAEAGMPEEGPCSPSAQIDRMLDDPRSERFIQRFLRAWLGLRGLEREERDPAAYPHFLAARQDMAGETEAVFRYFLDEPLPATDLIRAPFTWVTSDLARHRNLGLPGVPGWFRIELDNPDDRGLLGHAGVLTATSAPDRSSPVLRGAWVLTSMLCDEPDPPPEGIPPLELDPGEDIVAALAAHTSQAACAGCHNEIDPLGIPLERFDHAGLPRSEPPPLATTPEGAVLTGPGDLGDWLAEDPRHARCITRTIATWALARAVHLDETEHLDDWQDNADGSWRGLLHAVLSSPSFTQRRTP